MLSTQFYNLINSKLTFQRGHFFRFATYTTTLKNYASTEQDRIETSVKDMSDKEQPKSEELVKIEKLTPNSKEVNTIVKVISKSEVRNVTGRDYSVRRVLDALVGDETGCVYLTLWDDNIDKINEEATLRITNGYVNLFRGNMRLNIGKYGSFQLLEESPITEVNTENNLSDKRYEQERRGYGGRGYGDRRGYQQRRSYQQRRRY
jgi:replication factor A1